jgi:FlaA1/EpsC-like NDP-sugar epimerase
MSNFSGQRALVTGGTGSVGKSIVLELLKRGIGHVSILSRDETKQYEMLCDDRFDGPNIELFVGDVRDEKAVANAMKKADIVFHCAAMKHVPFCEQDVYEAVQTNIVGALNVVRCAENEESVKTVVACSTDKACNPTTTMGATKLLQERVLQNVRRASFKKFVCVRFGNLFESRGSVFHHFFRQRKSGSIYLTHQDMTRFVSTLDEASRAMMYAATAARHGDIIVKRCKAVKMIHIAKIMAPQAEIRIVGVRQNEKLDEHLYNEAESSRVHLRGVNSGDEYFVISPQADDTMVATQPQEAYSSKDHCVDFDGAKMIVRDFCERCNYEL